MNLGHWPANEVFGSVALALLLVSCGRDGNAPARTATATVSPSPIASQPTVTPAPSPQQQVSAAYLAYWDAYSAALLNLDISRMQGFASGEELQRIGDEIDTLRSSGVAERVVVQHDFSVSAISDKKAAIVDRYVNNSFSVDPATKEPPTGKGSGEVLQDNFILELIDARWVVTQSNRQR